jgi:hypothetical protein
MADTHCTDIRRIYYPGRKMIYEDFNSYTVSYNIYDLIQYTIDTTKHLVVDKILSKIQNNIFKYVYNNYNNIDGLSLVFSNDRGTRGNPLSLIKNISTAVQGHSLDENGSISEYFGLKASSEKLIYDILVHIPIKEIFEISNKRFSCFLPGHTDLHSSAMFEINDRGEYIYHCYGCDKLMNIVKLVHYLLNIKTDFTVTRHDAFIWLKRVSHMYHNLTPIFQWQTQEYLTYFSPSNNEMLKQRFPVIYNRLRKSNSHFLVLTYILDMMLRFPVVNEKKHSLYIKLSSEHIKNSINEFYLTHFSIQQIKSSIKLLLKLGMLICLSDDEISKKDLIILDQYRIEQNHTYRCSIYATPKFGEDVLKRAEDIILSSEKSGAKTTGFTRDSLLLGKNDTQEADHIFVQDKNKGISIDVLPLYIQLKIKVEQIYNQKQYFIRKDIEQIFPDLTVHQSKSIVQKCLPGILEELHLHRLRYCKKLDTMLQIKPGTYHYGTTRIYVDKDIEI